MFLIHYGEIALKGKNRRDFETALKRDILLKLKKISPGPSPTPSQTSSPAASTSSNPKVSIKHKYLILEVDPAVDSQDVVSALEKVFGIAWFANTTEISRKSELDEIGKHIVKMAKPEASSDSTFKVSCKRADKRFQQKSPEIEREIGSQILQNTAYSKVNLTNPDHTYFTEIETDRIFIFNKKHRGPGGLPVGSNGRVLVLMSGGIDSPVAAYMMAKRGCAVDFLHFYVKEPAKNSKIIRLAQKVSEYTGNGKLFLAPYLPFNMQILEVDTVYELVLFRRFILKVAERICQKHQLKTIATGDNLGQVASQTLENMTAADDALINHTCMRPLLCLDKEEIITLAKKIGTYEISNEPHKDCCSIIDKHAKTRVGIEQIRIEEKKIPDYEKIIDETLQSCLTPANILV